MSNYYEHARRYNPDTFEAEYSQFRYKAIDLYPTVLYAEEQSGVVVLDPFKYEEGKV